MKKLIVVFSAFAFATTGSAFAQKTARQDLSTMNNATIPSEQLTLNGTGRTAMSGNNTWTGTIVLDTNLKEGQNTVFVKELTGTLVLTKSGDTFSNVIYRDAAGKSISLMPTRGGASGAPRPECKSKLPDACFGSADKNIGMCICKPNDISAGGSGYVIRMSTPPVIKQVLTGPQTKVRDGATLQLQSGHH